SSILSIGPPPVFHAATVSLSSHEQSQALDDLPARKVTGRTAKSPVLSKSVRWDDRYAGQQSPEFTGRKCLVEDYMGLAAIAWELFSGEEPGRDYAFFRQIVARQGGPVLDIGCGTGRLLLPLLREGEDVDGVDPSADMLALCRKRGARFGLDPVLYRQTLQTLELPRRYRTILVPCGTIQLILDRDEVSD